jgi:hypothetical protein
MSGVRAQTRSRHAARTQLLGAMVLLAGCGVCQDLPPRAVPAERQQYSTSSSCLPEPELPVPVFRARLVIRERLTQRGCGPLSCHLSLTFARQLCQHDNEGVKRLNRPCP